MALMVLPVTYRQVMAPRMASGIDRLAMSVIRQLPRKMRIMMETSMAPMTPFVNQAVDGLAGHRGIDP